MAVIAVPPNLPDSEAAHNRTGDGVRLRLAAALLGFCLPGAATAVETGEPLDPEKAFPATATAGAEGIAIDFRIARGYYLYKDRFRVETLPPRLPVSAPTLPVGTPVDDPFLGRTEIVLDTARLTLPFTATVAPGTYRLKVTAQGCAKDRICYAPFTQVLTVRVGP